MRRRRVRSERGQSTVEFALILPVIAVFVVGVVQAGLLLRDELAVAHAAREAARAVAVDPTAAAAERAAAQAGGLDPMRLEVTVRSGPRSGTRRVDVAYRAREAPGIGRLLGGRLHLRSLVVAVEDEVE